VRRYKSLLLLTLLALNGCSSLLPWGKNRNEIVYSPKATMVAKWSYGLGENETGLFAPKPYQGFVYAAGGDRQVAQIGSASGRPGWRVKLKLKNDSLSAAVGAGSNVVLAGTKEGTVVALNAENGK
jgi:outer membrane protein assembly factor BamB